MAGQNVANILVGAGRLWVSNPRIAGDAATPLPDTDFEDDPNAALDADNDWKDAGFTQEGLEIAYTPETGEVEVDQLKVPALIYNQGLDVSVNTTLAEATLENLALSWGLDEDDSTIVVEPDATDHGTTTFQFGTPGDFYSERSIAIVGNAPGGNTRVYYGRRVISAEGSTHTLSRTDNVAYDVTFRLLEDPEGDEGAEFGEIVDIVPPTS